MKITRFIVLLIAIFSTNFSYAQINNLGFETGSLSGWSSYIGTIASGTTFQGINYPVTNRIQLIDTNHIDLYYMNPILNPLLGKHCIKIGNDSAGSQKEGVRFTFRVPQFDTILRFAFYSIQEVGSHTFGDEAHNEMYIVDSTGNYHYEYSNYAFNFGAASTLNPLVHSFGWQIINVNVASYKGQLVTLYINNNDCVFGEHFGYLYFDYIGVGMQLRAFAGGNKTINLGDSSILGSGINTAMGGSHKYHYKWYPSTGLNNDTIATPQAKPFVTTKYILQVNDSAGQIVYDSAIVSVCNRSFHPSICLVTTNPTSTYNLIVWEKPPGLYYGVDSFYLYKDSAGVLFKIGAVHRDSLSIFSDLNSNNISCRYKIASLDTCGSTGALSSFHQNAFLQYNGSGMFSWTPYISENDSTIIASYDFLKDELNNGTFKILKNMNSNTTNYSDINYTDFTLSKYKLAVNFKPSYFCNPSKVYNQSYSNSVLISNTGINTFKSSDILVSPNPAASNITIRTSKIFAEKSYNVSISNLIGNQIFTEKGINNSEYNIPLNLINDGVYILNISQIKGLNKYIKLVIEH